MTPPINFTGKKALTLMLFAFLVTVAVRIPSLSHPFSRHHESIPALELVSIESWEHAGGPGAFNYIPVFNYQQEGDKKNNNNTNTDQYGNDIYISYGTGWNLLPYYTFKLLHLPPTPLALRILNIIIGLTSCLLLFKLMLLVTKDESRKYYAATIACIAFMFTPGTLWYFGNVYVNCSVAVPFIIAFLYCIATMILRPHTIRPLNLAILFVLIICLVSIDWIAVFLALTVMIVLLLKVKTNKSFIYPMIAIVLGIVTGIALIVYQFVSYLGADRTWNILTGKFGFRTFHSSGGFLQPLIAIATHFVTASLPLICLLVVGAVAGRLYKKDIRPEKNIQLIYTILLPALLLYNITFLSWTSVHEFSILYYTIIFAIAAGSLLPRLLAVSKFKVPVILLMLLTITQYYLINPPGKKALTGEPYNVYQHLGKAVANEARPDEVVFINLELLPAASFYAKRAIHYAASANEAKQLLYQYKSDKGIWIEQTNFQIVNVIYLHK